MKVTDIKCRKCGADIRTCKGWLERVNKQGEDIVAECRPSCDADLTTEQAVLGAIEYDGEKRDE